MCMQEEGGAQGLLGGALNTCLNYPFLMTVGIIQKIRGREKRREIRAPFYCHLLPYKVRSP